MAFRPLTDAECGQTNPLLKLTSHVSHDHAFADSHGQVFPSSSEQLVEQFLQETRAIPQSFRMDDLMREMHEIESQRSVLPPIPASTIKDQLQVDSWAQQYIEAGKEFSDDVGHEGIWAEIKSQEQNLYSDFDSAWAENMLQNAQSVPDEVQDKARELLSHIDDNKFVYSKFMKFMKQVGNGNANLEEGKMTEKEAQSWSEEFLGSSASKDVLSEAWADEHESATINNDDYNSQIWEKLQEEMKKVSELTDSDDHPWLPEYMEYYPQKEYTFSEDNPMLDVINPIERGKELLDQGDLPSAVLCFEAAVKKEPENAEAWLLLGTTQAENEQDSSAIPALRRCIELAPDNLHALMSLAVSLTNESYYNQATQTMLSWLRANPKYADLVPSDLRLSGQVKSLLDPNEHDMVQELFIKAAQRNPQDIDPEVQSGLGVLFNLSGDYDKAADCFRAALSVRQDDAKLWNKLGATLANGTKPEEAVDAYRQALSISPGFIRARYNVGITCINLSAYKEAAEHFLTALNQQARGRDVINSGAISQMSDTIWSTLRMSISLMNRPDLRTAVDNRDLKTLNEAFSISEN